MPRIDAHRLDDRIAVMRAPGAHSVLPRNLVIGPARGELPLHVEHGYGRFEHERRVL